MSDLRISNNLDYLKYGFSMPLNNSETDPIKSIETFNEIMNDKKKKEDIVIRSKEKKKNKSENNNFEIYDTYTKSIPEPVITYKLEKDRVYNKTRSKHQLRNYNKN